MGTAGTYLPMFIGLLSHSCEILCMRLIKIETSSLCQFETNHPTDTSAVAFIDHANQASTVRITFVWKSIC
jgi:hypothetical protein